MGVRSPHVGDVIRSLRERRGLSTASLARTADVNGTLVAGLEHRGPEIEQVTPSEWQALDRVAVTLGFRNGASLFRLVAELPEE